MVAIPDHIIFLRWYPMEQKDKEENNSKSRHSLQSKGIFCPDNSLSLAGFRPLPTGIGAHSFSLISLGRIQRIFIPPASHYCLVDRGGVDLKLSHMTSAMKKSNPRPLGPMP